MKQSTKKTVDVIDFGFVKYSNRYSSGLKFVPNKMLRDMAYIHEEVVMDMFINPLFENESDSQEGLSEENTRDPADDREAIINPVLQKFET